MAEDRILVTRKPPGRALTTLAEVGVIDLWDQPRAIPPEVLRERIGAAAGLYSMLTDTVDESLLAAAPELRAISQMAVGVDNIDVDAATARGIPVGHTPDVLTETVADTAFGLLIAGARRLVEGVDYVRAGQWQRWEPDLLLGQDVHGSVLGILGMGRVGLAIATRANAFGMTVIYTSRTDKPEAAELGAESVSFDELLVRSDHVVITVALTEETTRLIDADALAAMKPTATLVNVSRGPTVDTDALVEALRSGQIAAAALDVTDPEPLPSSHELLALPNCTVIPHLGSSSAQTRAAMANLAADNLVAGLSGRRMIATVNPFL